uniref:Saccharopine dehydrogenase [NAD(+), L-lysine-forming] n=1 Tax=Romanomermis culicivorax TaxID=13658 RepID=A0A915I4F8_ROMCU
MNGDHKSLCVAIKRETTNPWERRAPLAPRHVKFLSSNGIKVIVQPCNRRDYVVAGATISEDISKASLIIGIKASKIEDLLSNRTYAFFSHTVKSQPENMPLLGAILQKNIRLIDYEKIVDENGHRTVMFGKWAGRVGMINILHGLGLRLLALGFNTPLMHISLAHNYHSYQKAKKDVQDVAEDIALGLMPRSLPPLIFVFTGNTDKVYGCVVSRADYICRKDGSGYYDEEEYSLHPELYESNFAAKIAPYASVIVNGIYWERKFPRLIASSDAQILLRDGKKARLMAVCDISADSSGSMEFMTKCTTIDRPFCIYDPERKMCSDSLDSPTGVLLCSIDNMPAQMPLESTDYFGDRLINYVFDMLLCSELTHLENFRSSVAIKNAVIASNGKLTPGFSYLATEDQKGAISLSINM